MKVVLSHPTGNANVRAVLKGFVASSLVYKFKTSIAVFADSWLFKISNIAIFSELKRRIYDKELQPFTIISPWFEIGRILASKFKLASLIKKETGLFSIDSVYTQLDKSVASGLDYLAKTKITGVYAYEDGAYHSFLKAKSLGIKCIYDLPIGYWKAGKKILMEETINQPLWAPTLGGMSDSDAKLFRKDEEIRMADIIYVASNFTKQTLLSYSGVLPQVEVIPYGFPEVNWNRSYGNLSNRPLKILFVGGLSQRKGIANLFDAVKKFENNFHLTVVGKNNTPDLEILNKELAKHTWIPSLTHKDVLSLMSTQDLLVFPSLFEGFGLVITEAMSQGTPVITTECTAGPEFIASGENGWLINAGSTLSLIECLEGILVKPDILVSAGKSARDTAFKRPWELYSNEISTSVQKFLRV